MDWYMTITKRSVSEDSKIHRNANKADEVDEYNDQIMISPSGEIFYIGESSHIEWAHDNFLDLGIDFSPTKTAEGDLATYEEGAIYDNADNMAIDAFISEGWIRVQKNNGLEFDMAQNAGRLDLIKGILKEMAVPEGRLYVETPAGDADIPVDVNGDPNFVQLDALATGGPKPVVPPEIPRIPGGYDPGPSHLYYKNWSD